MDTRKLFCPECGHDVDVTVTQRPLHGGHATLPDGGELVCLDLGPRCTGDTCPVSTLPRTVMAVRLARSGLRPGAMDTVRAVCDGCQRLAKLSVVDGTHAICPYCETVNVWAMMRLDGEEWVGVTGQRAEQELR